MTDRRALVQASPPTETWLVFKAYLVRMIRFKTPWRVGVKLGLVFTVKNVFEYDGNLLVEFPNESGEMREHSWSKKLVEQLLAELK